MRSAIGFFGIALLAASTVLCGTKAAHYYRAWKIAKAHPVYDRTFAEANGALEPPETARVIFFGDSRIALWDPLPDLGGAQLVLRGIGGETTEQMRFRLERDVLSLNPDWIVLQAGINDLIAASLEGPDGEATMRETAKNLADFVRASRERDIGVVLLSVIPPSRRDVFRFLMWPKTLDRYVDRVNADLQPISENADVKWIDTRAVLQDAGGLWLPNVNADTLHLTREGYARLNRAVELVLESERDAFQ